MRIFPGILSLFSVIMIFGVTGLAECIQEPSEPLLFCVTPDEPVAAQITTFELSDQVSARQAMWDFGDGQKVSTQLTQFVDHKYTSPGRYTVKVWVTNDNGSFNAATQTIMVHPDEPEFVPTPITQFDLNNNRRIDNVEFFEAMDLWINHGIRDLTFFEVLDAWINGSLVVEVRRIVRSASSALTSVEVFDLTGRKLNTYGCSQFANQQISNQQFAHRLSQQNFSVGSYVVVERNCSTGQAQSRFVLVR